MLQCKLYNELLIFSLAKLIDNSYVDNVVQPCKKISCLFAINYNSANLQQISTSKQGCCIVVHYMPVIHS